jgi:hypothetical protein
MEENLGAANVALTAEEMRDLDAAPANAPVRQPRLSEAHMSFIDR